MTVSPLLPLATRIDAALPVLTSDPAADNEWSAVASAASTIADTLRNRNGPVDNHALLGRSSLPQSIGALLKLATPPLSPAATSATFELLRVGANLCSSSNSNRQALLDAGAPSTVAGSLDAYWEKIAQGGGGSLGDDAMEHLKIIKTSIGFLLNASVGFEPVRTLLLQRKAPLTILRLSTALYTPGAWAATSSTGVEEWRLRSGLSAWSWQAIETLKTGGDEDEDEQQAANGHTDEPLFDADAIPAIISALKPFVSASSPSPSDASMLSAQERQEFTRADTEVLTHVSMLLESLSLDSEEARLALAQGTSGPPPMLTVVDFVENAAPPGYWNASSSAEKSLAVCKAAVIKAIVIAAGEDKSLTVLWDATAKTFPGGWFVERMTRWIKNADKKPELRDDLVICATLSLGNLARKPAHCISLLAPPVSLAPHLLPFLDPKVDIKIKHGVLGLLKHLAQPPQNKDILGSAGFIEALALSGIWQRQGDIAEVVQNSAIGVAKHLSYYNAANALKLVNPPSSDPSVDSPLDQILDLVGRSDAISLQSEGTRVLVNVIKGLFSLQSSSGGITSNGSVAPSPITTQLPQFPIPINSAERQEAIKKIATLDSAEPLAEMIGQSGKYPILLNEAVVSLTLLSSQPAGLSAVLQALATPLPYYILPTGMATANPPPSPQSPIKNGITNTTAETATDKTSSPTTPAPAKTASQPLDVLAAILRNPTGAFPQELGANVCTLLAAVGKAGGSGADADAEPIKKKMTPVLEGVLAGGNAGQLLQNSVRRTLDAWKVQSAAVS